MRIDVPIVQITSRVARQVTESRIDIEFNRRACVLLCDTELVEKDETMTRLSACKNEASNIKSAGLNCRLVSAYEMFPLLYK